MCCKVDQMRFLFCLCSDVANKICCCCSTKCGSYVFAFLQLGIILSSFANSTKESMTGSIAILSFRLLFTICFLAGLCQFSFNLVFWCWIVDTIITIFTTLGGFFLIALLYVKKDAIKIQMAIDGTYATPEALEASYKVVVNVITSFIVAYIVLSLYFNYIWN